MPAELVYGVFGVVFEEFLLGIDVGHASALIVYSESRLLRDNFIMRKSGKR